MAATQQIYKKTLVLTFQEGYDGKGKAIIKRYSYSNIDPRATAQSLVETAQAISSLCKNPVFESITVDNNLLQVI